MSTNIRHTGKKNPIIVLPSQPVFDYTALMESLKEYKRPRDKVTSLLKRGTIIRIKKGLYLANREKYHNVPVKEVVANILYGPSYISLQYALSLHGLIPEYAEHITSVTFKKTKTYHTPIGDYTYRSVPYEYYLPGVVLCTTAKDFSYLIASPEKALADMVYFTPFLFNLRDVEDFLFGDLRVDQDSLHNLNMDVISSIGKTTKSGKLILLKKVLVKITNETSNQ